MNELQHLSEKDLEYFKQQQAEGKPVKIISLDPNVLSEISFDDIEKMERTARENRNGQLSEEEMEAWLRKHHAIVDRSEKPAADEEAGRKKTAEKTGGQDR